MFVTLSVWLKYVLFVIFWDIYNVTTKLYQKIKNSNRASNEPYNLFEFLKFPIEDSSLLINFFPFYLFWNELNYIYSVIYQ